MGAWGMGVFDDDTSCDLLYEAMESNAKAFIENVVGKDVSEYLEYEEGHEYIVSGAIVDSILNKTNYSHNTEGYDEWLAEQSPELVEEFIPKIITGLNRVLSENSELNELWMENEEDYPEWKSNIEKIITALTR